MVPTKPFGVSGGTPGVMQGGGARKAAVTASSDGLAALTARLAGAKRMKAMKAPPKRQRTKPDMAATGNVMPTMKGV